MPPSDSEIRSGHGRLHLSKRNLRIESKGNRSNFLRDFSTPLGQSKGSWATRRGLGQTAGCRACALLTACCTWPMRSRRPEGAAGTASDAPRPAAAADVQLRLLAFAGTVDGRLGVQSQIQLCCSSAGPRISHKSHEFAWQVPHTGRR